MEYHIKILRSLAREYHEISQMGRYRRNLALHRAVNDNRMIRPVVLIDEVPWSEMNFDGSLTPVCPDGILRETEVFLRRMIYRHRHFPADMLVRPYIAVRKVVHDSGIGIVENGRVLATDLENHIVSHEYHDLLADERSLERLHPPVITYDRDETLRHWQAVGDALGDILPVRLEGVGYFYTAPWDWISTYRGVEPLLYDLADRPEYSHRMVALLTDFECERLRQYEEQGLLDPEPCSLHCTTAAVSDLPSDGYAGGKFTRRDVWGRGAAQIFSSASAAMRLEFDIEYMKRTIGTCGLAYYGCCEPLDRAIDVVAKIPNLRKISVTPWADVRVAADAIAGRYVVAAKPNPAALAVPRLDHAQLRLEIGTILKACADSKCSCDIVLKDISTCHCRPENIFEWEHITMQLVGAHDAPD
jgi:hypothetical protein